MLPSPAPDAETPTTHLNGTSVGGPDRLTILATTKVINVFSSAVATAVFTSRGVVDYKLGSILGVTMFVGAMVRGHTAMKLSHIWLRRIFVTAALVVAIKMLANFVHH